MDGALTLPWGGVPGMSIQEKSPGQTQDMLERFSLSAGLEVPRDPPEMLAEVQYMYQIK